MIHSIDGHPEPSIDLEAKRMTATGPLLFGADGTQIYDVKATYDEETRSATVPQHHYRVENQQGSYNPNDDEHAITAFEVSAVIGGQSITNGLVVIRSGDTIGLKRGPRTVTESNFRGNFRKEVIDATRKKAQQELQSRWRLGSAALSN